MATKPLDNIVHTQDLPDQTLLNIAMAFYRRARKWDDQLDGDAINHDQFYDEKIMKMQIAIALHWLELDGYSIIKNPTNNT